MQARLQPVTVASTASSFVCQPTRIPIPSGVFMSFEDQTSVAVTARPVPPVAFVPAGLPRGPWSAAGAGAECR